MKFYVYVDGFNLYYRALKCTPGARWLDLGKLAEILLPNHDVEKIHYFTAKVRARTSAEEGSVTRQHAYLRALRTVPGLDIHFGHMAEHVEEDCELVTPIGSTTHVHIFRRTEKGSDVNLATQLLLDAASGAFDGAAVITNDSDQCAPIRAVRDHFGRRVMVLDPTQKDGESKELKAVASDYRRIRVGPILGSQFAEMIHDKNGSVRRPAEWAPPAPTPPTSPTPATTGSSSPSVISRPASSDRLVAPTTDTEKS